MTKRIASSTTAKKPTAKRTARAVTARAKSAEQAKPLENAAQREHAARLIAMGMTQQATADRVAVDLRTVQRWVATQGFLERVDALRIIMFERLEVDLSALLTHAMEVHHRVMNGEASVDDAAYIVADKLLTRFVEKLFAVESPLPPHGQAGTSFTLNVGGSGGGAERRHVGADVIDGDAAG